MINPLDGSTITAYNLNKTAFGRPADLYQTNADQDKRRNTYTGYEMSFTGRLPHGGHLLASWTIDRITDITCDAPIGTNYYGYPLVDGNNFINSSLNDPNSLGFAMKAARSPSAARARSSLPCRSSGVSMEAWCGRALRKASST